MKKFLSLFLAVLMLFSCLSVISVSAEEDKDLSDVIYSEETVALAENALRYFNVTGLPSRFDGDLNSLKNLSDGKYWREANLISIPLSFLYSGTGSLDWSELDVYVKDANGNYVYNTEGFPQKKISPEDISLAMSNVSVYLQRVFYNVYGGLNLYTVENAISMANFIGNMIYPNFADLLVDNYKSYFGNEIPSANEFFEAVTSLSGLDDVINQNWVTRTKAFCEPLVNVLGSGYITFLDDYYNDGLKLGSKIIEGMVKKILTVGPVDFIMDLLNVFASSSYELVYREPTLALFSQKIASLSEHMTVSELNSFTGLLKLIFCDCDSIGSAGCYASTPADVNHFCPFEFPVSRYNSTNSKDEKLIYLYYYFNICGKYRGNDAFFRNIQLKINSSYKLSADDKTKLNALIDGFFLGDFDSAVDTAIIPLYKENISTVPDSIFERMKNALMVFLKKIADYFDYLRKIFTGELQYGQGNSPFN